LLILPSLASVTCAGIALRLLSWAWGLRDSERLARAQGNDTLGSG
jgi:hypothetical protein